MKTTTFKSLTEIKNANTASILQPGEYCINSTNYSLAVSLNTVGGTLTARGVYTSYGNTSTAGTLLGDATTSLLPLGQYQVGGNYYIFDGTTLLPIPVPNSNGDIVANIVPRTNTIANLKTVAGVQGELASATDQAVVLKYTGTGTNSEIYPSLDFISQRSSNGGVNYNTINLPFPNGLFQSISTYNGNNFFLNTNSGQFLYSKDLISWKTYNNPTVLSGTHTFGVAFTGMVFICESNLYSNASTELKVFTGSDLLLYTTPLVSFTLPSAVWNIFSFYQNNNVLLTGHTPSTQATAFYINDGITSTHLTGLPSGNSWTDLCYYPYSYNNERPVDLYISVSQSSGAVVAFVPNASQTAIVPVTLTSLPAVTAFNTIQVLVTEKYLVCIDTPVLTNNYKIYMTSMKSVLDVCLNTSGYTAITTTPIVWTDVTSSLPSSVIINTSLAAAYSNKSNFVFISTYQNSVGLQSISAIHSTTDFSIIDSTNITLSAAFPSGSGVLFCNDYGLIVNYGNLEMFASKFTNLGVFNLNTKKVDSILLNGSNADPVANLPNNQLLCYSTVNSDYSVLSPSVTLDTFKDSMATIAVTNSYAIPIDITVVTHTATSTLSTFTFTLPPLPRINQTITITCNSAITTLIINAATVPSGVLVYGAPASLLAGQVISFKFIFDSTSASSVGAWFRCC